MHTKHLKMFLQLKLGVLMLTILAINTACNNNIGNNTSNKNKQHNNKQNVENLNIADLLQHNELWQHHLELNNKYLHSNQEMPIHMGDGFDARTGMSKGDNCLVNYRDPSAMHISNQRVEAHFDSASDSSTISSMIGASLSGKANYGIFSASANAQYARNISDTRQSVHFTYWQTANADVTFDVQEFGNDALRPSAKELLTNGGGYSKFTEVCGDSFIKSAQIGAILLVDVAVNFASSSDKSTFQSHFKAGGLGFGGIQAALDASGETIRNSVHVSVSAKQLGGDISKFKIFGDKTAAGYALTECANGVFSRCGDMITGVIDYAQDRDNGFPASVEHFKNPDSLLIYNHSEKYYRDIGIHAEPMVLPDSVIADKDILVTTINHDRRMYEYLQAYQRQTFMVNIDALTQDWLKKATDNYKAMIDEYDNYDIVDACYGDTSNLEARCHSAVAQVKAMRSHYQKYIDNAEKLSTVVAEYHPFGTFKYIPNSIGSGCVKDSNTDKMLCTGTFAQYSDGNSVWKDKHVFNDLIQCVIDTTPNASYFTQQFPKQANKSLLCWDHDAGFIYKNAHWNNYIRRQNTTVQDHGITGYWSENNFDFTTEKDLPVDASGYNDQFLFSDSSDFLYNPI